MKFSEAFVTAFIQWLRENKGLRSLPAAEKKKLVAVVKVPGVSRARRVDNPFRFHPPPGNSNGPLTVKEDGHNKICLIEGQHQGPLMASSLKLFMDTHGSITQTNLRVHLLSNFKGVGMAKWVADNMANIKSQAFGKC